MIGMVEELFEEYGLPQGFTEKVLEEAIESAEKAEREFAYNDVLKSCDRALEILDKLDVSTEYKRSMMDVLRMKGRATEFVRSCEESIKHYREKSCIFYS